jgi:hypothetical protein
MPAASRKDDATPKLARSLVAAASRPQNAVVAVRAATKN